MLEINSKKNKNVFLTIRLGNEKKTKIVKLMVRGTSIELYVFSFNYNEFYEYECSFGYEP